jgi:hypothetical protein
MNMTQQPMTEDEQHLNLLSLFHYIFGGLTALFACIPLIHVTIGLLLVSGKFDDQAPQWFGWIFVGMGGFVVLSGWALAAAILVCGRKLKQRTGRTYCLVVGALECALMPLGTVLGIFTLLTLSKESVKVRFEAPPAA